MPHETRHDSHDSRRLRPDSVASSLKWLNIIILMGGMRDEFLNQVKQAVAQLPADQRTWEHITETAAVQQDQESNLHTRVNSFSKGWSVNYTGQRGRNSSPGNKGGGGG